MLVHRSSSQILARCYYGPFKVAACVGEMANHLILPDYARIHPVFHVSLLKPFKGELTRSASSLPAEFVDGNLVSRPLRVHDYRTVLVGTNLVRQALVEWSEGGVHDATWESVESLRRYYPELHLADKVLVQPRRNVVNTPQVHGDDSPGEVECDAVLESHWEDVWEEDRRRGTRV
ncbi:unnamed protein product [Cuscuta campestris]|uniref:Tf2-1-like SH3-like domain-containing protein n=1 Tax=Cuscuta campestris TaxID=132261 RepID=A0A484KW08_9ASTE|nr:unnamed protein product [Cuscuta campestris]